MLVSAPKEIKAHEYRVGLTGSVENSKDRHLLALGRVDGFDEDETQSKCDEGTVVHVSLLAA